MSTPLRVLIVEDPPDDAARVLAGLRQAGYEPDSLVVGSAEAMRAALASQTWDIVLSDYVTPGFGGLQALKLARAADENMPVVMLSSKVGEEKAVEAIKAGATDFVRKDQLARLPPVVKRELIDAAARRGMRRAQIEWRLALDAARDAVFIHDQEGVILRANAQYAKLGAMPIQDVIGKPYWKVFPRADGPLRACVEACDTGTWSEEEIRLPGGGAYLLRSYPHLDLAGRYVHCINVVLDITSRKMGEQRLAESARKLSLLLHQTIETVARAVETRDPYTAGHQRRVADLAVAIGSELGMSGEALEGLRLGATIHDIGKIYVPAEILSKPGKLSPAEFELIKAHPQIGYDIMKGVDFPWPVALMILQHHERIDGSGYPNGLKDGAIIREARILAVADVVEAMASHRPYRAALGLDAALKEVDARRGTGYDGDIVDACVQVFRKGYALDKSA